MSALKIRNELNRLANLQVVSQFSKQLGSYEKKVKGLVKGFDVKSREARVKGLKQMDAFASQVKKVRGQLEKRVREVLNKETDRLNEGLTELFKYLKTVSKSEKLTKSVSKKTAVKAKGSTRGYWIPLVALLGHCF